MAEEETSQSGTGFQTSEPITDPDSASFKRNNWKSISFESFESTTMLPDCKGWLTETTTGERYWCVAASKTLGLFDSPEEDKPKIVLTLTNFQVEASVKDVDSENCEANKSESSAPSIPSNDPPTRKECVLELMPVLEGDKQFSFHVSTEEEFLLWREALVAFTEAQSASRRDRMVRQKKISFEERSWMDSGLGDELDLTQSAQRREGDPSRDVSKLPKQASVESETGSRDGESRSEHVQSRTSSFVSSLATTEDLADSHSISDSASGDNNSTANLSENDFADSETNSYSQQSLNDSVFLGASQELDPSLWSESKDTDSFVSDMDSSAPTSPCAPTSTRSSAGDASEQPRSDQHKTMISKVSKLVHRVAQMRRPRVMSGLTLGHIPNPKMSGSMRKKGKGRWYVLSESCLYCFKTNSPEAEAETILDLASYSVAMATEEKEDGQSIGLLKLTHSTGKKVLLSINSIETAKLWFNYIEDAIRKASASKAKRSDSQKSTSSNPDSQHRGKESTPKRMSRESFEDSYGYFERQSSLRAERDAVRNAITEAQKTGKDSSSGSSLATDEKQDSRSLSDVESVTPTVTTWGSSDDLDLPEKKANPTLLVKRSIRSSLPTKQNVRQMPIPASDVVDPTLTGFLHVYMPSKGAWKKSWAVLKDDWLYFYKKPTDTSTSDLINLPNCKIQRERTLGDGVLMAQQKLMFSISHEDGSNRTVLMADTDNETRSWMEKMKGRTRLQSSTLDGLNLESGSASLQFPPSGSSEKWHKDQAKVHKQKLLMEVLQGGQQMAPDLQDLPVKSDNPEISKKREEILAKYQKANDEEEEELVRMMTVLNRRRMSAQVKKEALQRTIDSKTKKRVERLGSVEESAMEDQIRILNARLKGISAEIDTKSMQKTNRLKALKEKKELELQLLEQQEKLSRYRRLAQDALQGPVDFQSALTGLEEESPEGAAGSSDEETDRRSAKSTKEKPAVGADETDSSSKAPEYQPEKAKKGFSPALLRRIVDKSPPKSPNSRPRKLLPILPDKRNKPLKASPLSETPDGKSSPRTIPVDEKLPQVQMSEDSGDIIRSHRSASDSKSEKTSSPLLKRIRKISAGSRMAPDTTPSSKEQRNHKGGIGLMKASVSFDEGLRLETEELQPPLKHSTSSTDLKSALKSSPTLARAIGQEPSKAETPSPQRRRKISVPMKLPSMDMGFFQPSKGNKEKTRKTSTGSAPSLDNGAVPRNPSKTGGIGSLSGQANTTVTSSKDINGNMDSVSERHKDRSKGGGRALKDEIDPEVLRDIEEFEMMARKALQEAGWTFRS